MLLCSRNPFSSKFNFQDNITPCGRRSFNVVAIGSHLAFPGSRQGQGPRPLMAAVNANPENRKYDSSLRTSSVDMSVLSVLSSFVGQQRGHFTFPRPPPPEKTWEIIRLASVISVHAAATRDQHETEKRRTNKRACVFSLSSFKQQLRISARSPTT